MRRSTMLLSAVVVALAAGPVVAMGTDRVSGPATGAEPAGRVALATDVVTIYNIGALSDGVADAAFAAARAAGGTAAIGRSASTGMPRIRRGSAIVQQAPSGWTYPMGTTILPAELVGPIMGFDVSAALSATELVMGRRTADLRGAQEGDIVDLVASSGTVVSFAIGAVVDDAITGGTELLLSDEAGDRLGITRLSRIVLWGFDSRAAIDAELALHGLVGTSIRILRSWDPANPDSTLGMARTKAGLGEFAYRVNSNGSVSVDGAWHSQNISKGDNIGELTLRSGCHITVRIALQAAMDEVIAAGLEDRINYVHANTAGGCYVPRFSRLAPNSSIGFLSRHTWGMAIDTNTVGSCQGCAPPDFATMTGGCDLVRILRKHGFAWGGNFLRPDGMHFEWVGEPRDQLPYPSRYCANEPASGDLRLPSEDSADFDVTMTERATMFAGDGLFAEG